MDTTKRQFTETGAIDFSTLVEAVNGLLAIRESGDWDAFLEDAWQRRRDLQYHEHWTATLTELRYLDTIRTLEKLLNISRGLAVRAVRAATRPTPRAVALDTIKEYARRASTQRATRGKAVRR